MTALRRKQYYFSYSSSAPLGQLLERNGLMFCWSPMDQILVFQTAALARSRCNPLSSNSAPLCDRQRWRPSPRLAYRAHRHHPALGQHWLARAPPAPHRNQSGRSTALLKRRQSYRRHRSPPHPPARIRQAEVEQPVVLNVPSNHDRLALEQGESGDPQHTSAVLLQDHYLLTQPIGPFGPEPLLDPQRQRGGHRGAPDRDRNLVVAC